MTGTIFHDVSLDRAVVRWEEYMSTLTPVQAGSRCWWKREDYFAPLGYGGINGSKLRQCIWLLQRAHARGYRGVLSAGSVKSPQHAMVATVARHYGMRSYHILGATKPTTARRHDSVDIAYQMGAQFEYLNVGYNPVLQSRVRKILEEPVLGEAPHEARDYYRLEYAISLDHQKSTAEDLLSFHSAGAAQFANLPATMQRLLIPAGSCNSACSILLGLYRLVCQLRPIDIHLIGIGHNRRTWLAERPGKMGVRMTSDAIIDVHGISHQVSYHDLVDGGYCTYQDMWDENADGIRFHRTYESKCWRWLRTERPDLLDEHTLFWVVGSEPRWAAMAPVVAASQQSGGPA